MASIHETAYPRIKSTPSTEDLIQVYTPSSEEQQWAEENTRLKRERMLAPPRLFCQTLQAQAREQAAKQLRAGPEGAWLATLKQIGQRLQGLHKQLPLVFAGVPETGPLQQAWVEVKTLFQDIDETVVHNAIPLGSAIMLDVDSGHGKIQIETVTLCELSVLC